MRRLERQALLLLPAPRPCSPVLMPLILRPSLAACARPGAGRGGSELFSRRALQPQARRRQPRPPAGLPRVNGCAAARKLARLQQCAPVRQARRSRHPVGEASSGPAAGDRSFCRRACRPLHRPCGHLSTNYEEIQLGYDSRRRGSRLVPSLHRRQLWKWRGKNQKVRGLIQL